MVAILKFINGGYYKNQVICPHILYDVLHSCPSIHEMYCKYSHVDQSYNNFEFLVAAILKKNNGGHYMNHVICPQIFGMICYTAGHKYKNFHANIHTYTKVTAILSFQWRPF